MAQTLARGDAGSTRFRLSGQGLIFQKGDVASDFAQIAPNFRNITLQSSQTFRMTGLGLEDPVHLPVKRAQKCQRVARRLRSILLRGRIGHASAFPVPLAHSAYI
jgi:hypothetical protein